MPAVLGSVEAAPAPFEPLPTRDGGVASAVEAALAAHAAPRVRGGQAVVPEEITFGHLFVAIR